MSATTDYQFFFSYARVDRDLYLERFLDDLARAVRRLVPLPSQTQPRDIGFYDDGSIDVGDSWSDALVGGLQTARTFVALLTPGYVNSESCGRELAVFLARVRAGTGPAPGRQALLLPVMWERPLRVTLSPPLEESQWSHRELGATYADRGLRFLAKRGPTDPDYVDFVDEFAARLVSVRVTRVPPLHPEPRWDTTPSAFSTAAATAGPDPVGTSAGDVPTACFAFLAGSKAEVAGVRQDVTAYGGSGVGWRPFAPSDPETIGLTSQNTAGREGLLFKALEVDGGLVQRIRDAEKAGEIVVLVVDPWTVQLQSYRACLSAVDEAQFVNFGVLVPLNPSDLTTLPPPEAVRGYVRQVLRRTYVVNRSYIRDAIGTREDFERELVAAIADARRRMSQLNAVSVWNGAATRPIPVVTGPASRA